MSDNPTYEQQVEALLAHVEGTPDPANPESQEQAGPPERILGKYDDKDVAKRSLHELAQKMKGEETLRRSLEMENAQLKTRMEMLQQAQTTNDDAADPLDMVMNELAIENKGAFRKAIDARAAKVAEEKLKPILTALSGAMELAQADQQMLNEFGEDYYRDLPGLRKFLTENDSVKEVADLADARGQHLLARKYVYAEYRHHQQRQGEARVQGQAQEREQEVEQAKQDGSLIGSSRKEAVNLAKPKNPKLSRERASKIVQDVRKGDWHSFDEQFIVPLLPSEDELERMTGWKSIRR